MVWTPNKYLWFDGEMHEIDGVLLRTVLPPGNVLIPWADMKLTKAEWRDILCSAAESKGDVPYEWWVLSREELKVSNGHMD